MRLTVADSSVPEGPNVYSTWTQKINIWPLCGQGCLTICCANFRDRTLATFTRESALNLVGSLCLMTGKRNLVAFDLGIQSGELYAEQPCGARLVAIGSIQRSADEINLKLLHLVMKSQFAVGMGWLSSLE